MSDSAEDDEGPLAERDVRDGEPGDAQDTGEYAGPEAYDEEEPQDEEPEYEEAEDEEAEDEEPEYYGEQRDDGPTRPALPGEACADTAVPRDEAVVREKAADAEPDVYLDVPLLKVDEIDLDVENLRAHVSLQAEVLDLLKLNVGADVALGRVHLGISGVEAQARLKVRLDNVALIINRVLTTLDRNPQILEDLTRGIGSAVRDIGGGARQAVGELGAGTGRAVGDIGQGAGSAVRDVGRGAGEGVRDLGRGAGRGVEGVGRGAGQAVEDVGRGAGGAVGEVGRGAGRTVEDAAGGVTGAVAGAGEAAGDVVEGAAGPAAGVVEDVADAPAAPVTAGVTDAADLPDVPDAPRKAAGTVRRTARPGRTGTRAPEAEHRDPVTRSGGGARTRRARAESGKSPARPARRRAAGERDEPP